MTGLSLSIPDDFVDQVASRVLELLAEQERGKSKPEPWLNVTDAAEYLACRKQRVHNLTSQGRLRYAKDGSRVVFKREWLDDLIEGGGA
jgi:excisionase family DNA binding protein